jgi:hypothetical protein
MRHLIHLLVCTAATLPAAGQHAPAAGGDKVMPPDELFANACIGCHVAPDPDLATDKAWITQLFDTA